jgi:serine phosphatase RsbU (regulator of sigma subunit)
MTERGQWSGETFFQNLQTHEAIPVSDTHFIIRDASGKRILGYATITRDISEARRITNEREQLLASAQLAREQAESANAQLRESEERFRLTIDEAPIEWHCRPRRTLGSCESRALRDHRLQRRRADPLTSRTSPIPTIAGRI